MADTTGSLPLTAAAGAAHGPQPGLGTVLKDMFKDGIGLAVVGALVGLAATAVLAVVMGPTEAMNFISRNFFKLNAGGPIASTLCSGAALGALTGAAIGIPAGGIEGVCEIRDYYRDVAIPETARKAEAHGVEIGAELERKAMEHEAEGRKYREMITQAREQGVSAALGQPTARA